MCRDVTAPTRGSSQETKDSAVPSSSSQGRTTLTELHSWGDRVASRQERHTRAARTLPGGEKEGSGRWTTVAAPAGRRQGWRRPGRCGAPRPAVSLLLLLLLLLLITAAAV